MLEHSSSIQLLPSPQSPGHRSFPPYYLVPVAWVADGPGLFVCVEQETLCSWTSGPLRTLARKKYSCGLIFICIAASLAKALKRGFRTDDRVRRGDESKHIWTADLKISFLCPAWNCFIHVFMFIYPLYSAGFRETDFFLFQLNFYSITANVNRQKKNPPHRGENIRKLKLN